MEEKNTKVNKNTKKVNKSKTTGSSNKNKSSKTVKKEKNTKKSSGKVGQNNKEIKSKVNNIKNNSKEVLKEANKAVNELKDDVKKVQTSNKKDNLLVYKILAYVFIFWIIGLFVSEKDDKDLKFHIGQGIMLTLLEIVLSLIVNIFNNLVIANIFRTEVTYLGMNTGVFTTSAFGLTLMSIFRFIVVLISIIYIIIGIKNVLEEKKEELPIIGKYAFYK